MPKKSTGAAKRAPTKKRPTRKKTATRRPAAAAPEAPATPRGSAGRLQVVQVRSGIGHAATYRRTLRALGLKHHQDVVVLTDNPSIRGMLHKVRHLIRVTAREA